ncbi:MAG: hypothetical protein ACTHLT_02425 [Devosia sp.]
MSFDKLEDRAGGKDGLMPMQIAHNPLLTAREKLDLLNRLKAEVTGALENSEDLGVSPSEIEAAIQEIRLDVQNGVGEETVLRGDN